MSQPKYIFLTIAAACLLALQANAQVITTIAGNGTQGYTGDGGPASAATFSYISAIVIDNAHNIYIADQGNNVIRKIDTSGIVTTIAGGGTGGVTNGIPATNATLSSPTGITLDKAGNLYIADFGNIIIRKVNTAGIMHTIAGDGASGYYGDGGPATAAQFYQVEGMGIDTSGNIYIADFATAVVREITTDGIIITVAGDGTSGYSGDGGPAVTASLSGPTSVFLDNACNLYIADGWNNAVRMVNSLGTISTIAGNGYNGYSGDGGMATNALLQMPRGLYKDNSGNIYMADTYNNVIRKIDTAGIITTIAGNGLGAGTSTGGYSGDNGPATAAELFFPSAVAMDSAGNMFIADAQNYCIRKITPNTALSIPCATTLQYTPQLQPNPNSGAFHLKATLNKLTDQPATLEITNILGQLIYTKDIVALHGAIDVQVSLGYSPPPGMYLLHLATAGENVVIKFTVMQ